MLAALGSSLHNVQDFYAHSNWAELTDQGDIYGDATWFDVPEALKKGIGLHTQLPDWTHTDHNKDYPGRPHYETAYRCAYYASCQLVQLVRSWVSPGFWKSARVCSVPDISDDAR